MNTRGRPNGETWSAPGPLLRENPANTQTVKEESYTSTLSAKEESHFAECELHFRTIPLLSWERMAWSQRGIRKHPHSLRARCAAMLICGHRCGRPYVRTDTRDQQWYCGDHNLLLPKRRPKLLELPGEIRNEIYKYAFPPFLGLIPRHELEGSSIGLLAVNKQVHKEVISLMYGTKPLRLKYEEDDLSIDDNFYHWDGQDHYVGRYLGWYWNLSVLLRLLGRKTFQHVNDIEIYVDLEDSEDAERSILLDFVHALCTKRRTQPRRFTIKFTVATLIGEKEEVEFFRFLQALREVPEFKDVRFELEDPHQLKGEDGKQLLQRACAMRDSLLLGQKRKFEQFQE
ncbi:hypothetical protein K469DRAFT_687142 [Zopfia rhizophila CBS 207.26]|uniref:F-box domain-containing protein n=1 Tax=Zopfia rhizophila CBS 207.26 TaxID=1314779 RepID=A0A6A6D596_9PEZI|nr:hypothetical protein K469DRAFT_687142 [Zopfia rhizophila CBS 207.26]